MTNENNNVVAFPTKSADEAVADMQAEMAAMAEPAKPPISDYIDKENPVPVEEAQALPISGDAPVGIVISGGEATTVTEIPEHVKAMMEADAQADAAAEEPVEVPQLDENNPLNEVSAQQLGMLMKQVGEMMQMFEAQWNSTKAEFKLGDAHMRQLYAYNQEHAEAMPSGLTQEESIKFDTFNGLNGIPEEKVLEIFGEGHPIIGIEHTITIDRLKSVTQDFFSWMSAIREYQQIHDGYMELIEVEEEKEIQKLKDLTAIEQDPERKAKMEASLKLYYNRKFMDFIAEPLDEKKISILVKAFSDETKIQYWIDRARVKLGQLKINAKFILEISQLEKRFLPEEFHGHNNIFLLYFLNLVVYCDVYNKSDADRNKVACIIFGMDKFIRNVWAPEIREKILANMIEFQKQFVGKLAAPTAVVETPQEVPQSDVVETKEEVVQ